MPIQQITQNLGFQLTDKDGNEVVSFLERCETGVTLPPSPPVGAAVTIIYGGQSYSCTVKQSIPTYDIDVNNNISWIQQLVCMQNP